MMRFLITKQCWIKRYILCFSGLCHVGWFWWCGVGMRGSLDHRVDNHNTVGFIPITRCFHTPPSLYNNIHINKRYAQKWSFLLLLERCCWFLHLFCPSQRCILRATYPPLFLCIFLKSSRIAIIPYIVLLGVQNEVDFW